MPDLGMKSGMIVAIRPENPGHQPSDRPIAMNFSRRRRTMVDGIEPLQVGQGGSDGLTGGRNGGGGIAMRAARRFGHHRVDHSKTYQILRGDLHAGRGLLCLGGVAPEYGSRAFGRNDAVYGVLQHDHAVGGRNRDGAAGPPSPMIVATLGTPMRRQASVERAMASAWPRSSAPMPG